MTAESIRQQIRDCDEAVLRLVEADEELPIYQRDLRVHVRTLDNLAVRRRKLSMQLAAMEREAKGVV